MENELPTDHLHHHPLPTERDSGEKELKSALMTTYSGKRLCPWSKLKEDCDKLT